MKFDSIHETVVKDVFDILKTGVKDLKNGLKPRSTDVRMSGSLARATSGLTLAFPVACTGSTNIENAMMIAKAIERKNVSLLQMAFSAYNITNATDVITHLSKFHSNMDKKIDLDSFIDAMESLEEVGIVPENVKRAIIEDCKRNLNFAATSSVNETSLMDFSEATVYGQTNIIQEKNGGKNNPTDYQRGRDATKDDQYWYSYWQKDSQMRQTATDRTADRAQRADEFEKSQNQRERFQNQNIQMQTDRMAQSDRQHADTMGLQTRRANFDDDKFKYQKERDIKQDEKDEKKRKQDLDIAKGKASDLKRQYLSQQLVSGDVKKANELQPSLMVVNFYVNDGDKDLNIAQQAVIGVKSKLYVVNSEDIINRIITKHIDSDIMLKLIKVSTREISFVKDFLLGLDEAKINSLSRNRNNAGNRLLNALERRAIHGKIRKSLRIENSAKAIATLVITAEEAELLKKYNNIDVNAPRVIVPIMEKLNLLYFVILDDTNESIKIITDGDSNYEEYSFTALERENGDSSYKKIVNLMTKLA